MLKRLEIAGFKSFARKTVLDFSAAATSIVGPNGSGKSNVAEAFRFALGEQSMKSMRGKRSEDLIWSGSHTSPRANRAAVAIVFDNTEKHGTRTFPKLDFEEVTVERAVFRDGASEYSINGSKVRLRDVQELLAAANIGETGHHIISQGEADRILLAHPKERRAMLEDALGLKVYEFKLAEAERKLEKTEANVREVELIRREIAPHLRFLQKQVEKLERAEELARDLARLAQLYVGVEELYLETEQKESGQRKRDAEERFMVATNELAVFDERATHDSEGMKRAEAIRSQERDVDRLVGERGELAREIGRVEGGLHEAKKRSVQVAREPYVKVPREDLSALRDEIERQSRESGTLSESALRATLAGVRSMIIAFFERFALPGDDYLAEEEQTVLRLERERKVFMEKDAVLLSSIEKARSVLMKVREAALAYEETGREEKRRILGLAESKAHEEAKVEREVGRMRELSYLAEELEQGRAEVFALAGPQAFMLEPLLEIPLEERRAQEDRKRQLERLKIRLEEVGGTGEEARKECDDAVAREAFLARELEDLAKSAEGLRGLIQDLNEELQKTFAEGLTKVNASFGEFFALMFGGGGARLVLEEQPTLKTYNDFEEDEEVDIEQAPEGRQRQWKPGIEITVNLPRKKVQSLMQLSGGERALTSIALIFAMSQVNPPPFLILDETDAALDEANSRRYGDMIESLVKKSQLIVITHNRETMSRAGILYGVTMGHDGISKLLSVKFEEAVTVAK